MSRFTSVLPLLDTILKHSENQRYPIYLGLEDGSIELSTKPLPSTMWNLEGELHTLFSEFENDSESILFTTGVDTLKTCISGSKTHFKLYNCALKFIEILSEKKIKVTYKGTEADKTFSFMELCRLSDLSDQIKDTYLCNFGNFVDPDDPSFISNLFLFVDDVFSGLLNKKSLLDKILFFRKEREVKEKEYQSPEYSYFLNKSAKLLEKMKKTAKTVNSLLQSILSDKENDQFNRILYKSIILKTMLFTYMNAVCFTHLDENLNA